MERMRIHYFAAARAATGVSEEPAEAFDLSLIHISEPTRRTQ